MHDCTDFTEFRPIVFYMECEAHEQLPLKNGSVCSEAHSGDKVSSGNMSLEL